LAATVSVPQAGVAAGTADRLRPAGSWSASATQVQFLNDMQPLSSTYGVDTGAAEVNGQNFDQSVSLRADKNYIPYNDSEYDLGRHWATLDATIGIRDDSPSGSKLKFEAFADGKQISSTVLPIGQVQELKLDVTNVLRMQIKVTYASAADISNYCYGVWGDAQLRTG
jgi:hypothetical protein